MLMHVNMLTALIDLLFPPREDERIVRELTPETLAELVEPKLVGEVTVLLPFHDIQVRALVHEAKYHGSTRAFELLGGVLGEYLIGLSDEESFARAVSVPVPLSAARRQARGFNQVEEVLKRAAPAARLVIDTSILTRTRDTASQTSLARWQRLENMRGAFSAASVDPSYTYIVIDDVTTTGATLAEAAQALRAAGAARILSVALAH